MKFKFVIYYEEQNHNWFEGHKLKIISAKNKEQALKKFKEKYPTFKPIVID